MNLLNRLTVGGLLVVVAPLAAHGQGRIVRPAPPGPIGVTLPSPSLPRLEERRWSDDRPRHGIWLGDRWSYPIVMGSTVYQVAPQPVPYPVPVYYRVPAPRPEPPAVPYNPAASRTLVIGGGSDGGAGVMTIERPGKDSVHVTWRGSVRPVSTARLFLADAHHQPLVSRPVTLDQPDARFTRRGLARPAVFIGLVVTYANGSMQTTLVPVDDQPR